MNKLVFAMLLAITSISFLPAEAVLAGQIDDFQDLTAQNWREGNPSPNPPQNISTGGPGGAGDAFLQLISSGGGGPGSRMVAFNMNQWSGDYIAAGVTSIDMYLNNLGSTPLEMRLAFEDSTGTQFASTNSIPLSPGSGWTQVTFSLDEQDMTQVTGSSSYNTAFSDVIELRILSASSPSFRGDVIAGTLGIDLIVASLELCNGLDDDNDGMIDEDYPDLGDQCSVGVGECINSGERVCTQDGLGTQCNAIPGPPSAEVCDLLDNDCDNLVDEDLMCQDSGVIGGKIIPIESTNLILAGAQSFSWMIPVLLSGIGIGLFAVSRKSE